MTSSIIEEVQLVYHNKVKAADRPKIDCADSAYDIFKSIWDEGTINLVEEAKALFLDQQLRLMSVADISKGGITETVVDIRVVFAIALKRRACSIILAHNHPSTNPIPSQADIDLTKRFKKAGEMLRIEVQDHLIITSEGFTSLSNEGLM